MKWKMTTLGSEWYGSPFAKLVCANIQKDATFLSHLLQRNFQSFKGTHLLLPTPVPVTTVQSENKIIKWSRCTLHNGNFVSVKCKITEICNFW